MKILNFGSLNIDNVYSVDHFVIAGETQLSQKLNIFPGGKGLNQSIAMARAGQKVYHAGAVGAADGAFLTRILADNGIDTSLIKAVPGEMTGHAIIQIDRTGQNCILLYGGANQRITREDIDSVLEKFEAGDVVVLQNEISNLAYLIEEAARKGLKIILNPSPVNEALLKTDLSQVDVFIMNEIEAGEILGIRGIDFATADIEDKIPEKYVSKDLIITFGSQGSIFINQNHVYRQNAYRVKTVDTTAAGDTFTGYYIAARIKGASFQDALNTASKASGIACTRSGAEPSIPYLEELDNFSDL